MKEAFRFILEKMIKSIAFLYFCSNEMIEGSHFQLCAEYPNTEVNAAFATADNSFYVFSGNYYSKIRRFRRPPDLNPLRFNKLEGIFDEFFYYPEIEDGFPKRVQSEWNLHKSVDAGFTYESITYLVLGNDLWLFNNTKYMRGPIARSYFNFLNHKHRMNAIEYLHNFGPNGIFYASIPYRPFFDIVYTVEGNESKTQHEQIGVEIDAIAIFHKTDKLLEGVVFTNYSFNFFTGYWKTITEFSTYAVLQGFLYPNELFFGCPQIFCFSADVDTVLLDENDIGFVFRGNFFWHWFPSKALTVRDAKSIEAHFIGLPAYIDAGLTLDKGNVFIFKDDKLYKSSERLKFDYIEKRSLFEDVPEYVNAAWYHKNNESVYIFKGIDIFHYDMKSHLTDKRPISDFLGIPSYIDAAFTIHTADESYILKRSFFYKFEASYIRKRYFTPQLSFDVLFGCDKSYDYRKVGFENYNAFANRMAEFKPIPARSAFTKLRNVKHRHSMLDGERMLLAISATVILVAAVAITALFCEQIKRKHKAFEE